MMGCSACRGGTNGTRVKHRVRYPSGRVIEYVSEAEARSAARAGGGTYQQVRA